MNPDNLKNKSENQGEKFESIEQNHSLEDGKSFKEEAQKLTQENLKEASSMLSPEDSDFIEELKELEQEVKNINNESDLLLQQEYENILRQPMPIIGTKEYQERQNIIAHNISQRAYIIKSKIDEFTYFEELDDYIKNNPLFKPEDINFAKNVLKKIKEKIPEIKKTAIEYIDDIKKKQNIKNLFRSYLMINRLIGQNETSSTNLLSNESFENVVMESKNNSDIFSLDIFRNRDIQEYLKQDFNPEEYKKYYKEFIEQKLLAENKDNIKKYIKIQSIINSPKWQEMWNNIA